VSADDVEQKTRPVTLGQVCRPALGDGGQHGKDFGDSGLAMTEAEVGKHRPFG